MGIQTVNRQLVTVSSIPGDWAVASGMGGKHSTQSVRARAGGPKVPLAADYEANNVTTRRVFDAVADADYLTQLLAKNTFPDTTVTIQSLDAAGGYIGTATVLAGCSVAEWEINDADANGEGPVEVSITWAVAS